MGTRLGGDAGRRDLACHAPLRQAAEPVAGQAFDAGVDPLDERHPGRPRLRWMAVEHAVDVRQKHEQIGTEERGHERRETVVVAEARAQLLDADGVVFIDDRDHAVIEQGAKRVADVEIAGPVLHVVGHQEHLRGVPLAAAKHPLVGLDEAALPDRRHGLQMGELPGPRRQAHPAHARPDGAGADEHDPPALGQKGLELPAERLDPGDIEQAVAPGEHAGADLHDDESGGVGEGPARRISHGGGANGEASRKRDRILPTRCHRRPPHRDADDSPRPRPRFSCRERSSR